jgi:hypothetical protein
VPEIIQPYDAGPGGIMGDAGVTSAKKEEEKCTQSDRQLWARPAWTLASG